MLHDHAEWEHCMSEAVGFANPGQLRRLYATLLAHNNIPRPRELWDRYLEHLVQDFLDNARCYNPDKSIDEMIINKGLRDVEKHLVAMGKSLDDFILLNHCQGYRVDVRYQHHLPRKGI
jgi:hypothetical protein